MKEYIDNPAAFPCVHDNHLQEGMTLRDYFAAKVLDYAMKEFDTMDAWGSDYAKGVKNMTDFTYWVADAMLKARENE